MHLQGKASSAADSLAGALRDNRQRGGGSVGGYTSPPAAGSGSAMASAFAKLQGLKK
jgi:uncharacterized protein